MKSYNGKVENLDRIQGLKVVSFDHYWLKIIVSCQNGNQMYIILYENYFTCETYEITKMFTNVLMLSLTSLIQSMCGSIFRK